MAPAQPVVNGWYQTRASLHRLPNEILLEIAGHLDKPSLYRWLRSSRFFHGLLLKRLYHADIHAGPRGERYRSVTWGCQEGNLQTLRRAFAAGAEPNRGADDLYTTRPPATAAVAGPVGPSTWLKTNDDPAAAEGHAWHFVDVVLQHCHAGQCRWCPVPTIELLLAAGGTLTASRPHDPASGWCAWSCTCTMEQWAMVMRLRRVVVGGGVAEEGQDDEDGEREGGGVGPSSRPSREEEDEDADSAAAYYGTRPRACAHGSVPCSVAVARLLLEGGGASADLHGNGNTLASLAIRRSAVPVDMLRCLADAGGADLDRAVQGADVRSVACPRPPPLLFYDLPARGDTPLSVALEEAVRNRSLARRPRGRGWSCYPDARCPRAADVVVFLLSRGVRIGERTSRLLNRWDRGWTRWYVFRMPPTGSVSEEDAKVDES